MEAIEKKVLRTALNNLRKATTIPQNFANLNAYTEWIRNANRAAMDLVNIADTLMNEETTQNDGITLK